MTGEILHWLEHLIPAVCALLIAGRVGWKMHGDHDDQEYARGWNDAARLNGVYTDPDQSPDNDPPTV